MIPAVWIDGFQFGMFPMFLSMNILSFPIDRRPSTATRQEGRRDGPGSSLGCQLMHLQIRTHT